MTSSDTPDTGAGTPLTAEEEATVVAALNNVVRVSRHYWPNGHHIETFAREAIATLDAARSRPATDPAGLDALAVLDEVIRILTKYEHSVMVDSVELRRSVLARLSVADGPGPEERP